MTRPGKLRYAGPIAGIQEALAAQSTEFLPLSLGVSTLTSALDAEVWGLPYRIPSPFRAGASCRLKLSSFSEGSPPQFRESIA